MIYRVILHPQAAREAENAYLYIAQSAPETAVRWYNHLMEAMESLAKFPRRYPLAPENPYFAQEIAPSLPWQLSGALYRPQ
jgi:plasmid stabilization system protein ParE